MPIIPVLRKLGQENQKLEVSLGCIVRPCPKQINKNPKQIFLNPPKQTGGFRRQK
jgi:hypothetical protein